MNDTISISNTVSKADSDEEVSLLRASMADASGQVKGGIESAPISNERIQKNDPLLGTYTVTSDAIHGGMGKCLACAPQILERRPCDEAAAACLFRRSR